MQTLLSTKLYIPKPREESISRERLLAQLDAGAKARLILLSAPAGFGKTSLLSAWITHQEGTIHRVAWLSLDEGDNDPARFFAYLVAALERAHPGLAQALESLSPDLLQRSPPAVLTILINHLASQPEPLFLVLDDYHSLTSPEVHTAVAFLLEHQPPHMHLVIASRADPPLPLANLRARGELVEFRLNELRFNETESASLLSKFIDRPLSPADIHLLTARTEGWVAGLQMAALSLRSMPDVSAAIHSFTGSNRFILDYLLEEVLRRLPAHIQQFLLTTSILERLCAPLCESLLAAAQPASPHTAQEMLDYLDHANIFIVPLDQERCWYRYHRLFADLLQQQLLQQDAQVASSHHLQASQWFEGQGLLPEAIEYALQANAHDRAATLVEQSAEATLLRGEASTFLRWVNCLPASAIQPHPILELYRTWGLLLSGYDLESLAEHIEYLETLQIPSGARHLVRGLLGYAKNDIAQATTSTRQALAQLPEENLFLRSIAARILGHARLAEGKPGEWTDVLDEVARRSAQRGEKALAINTLLQLAEFSQRRADLSRAREIFEKILLLGQDPQGKPLPTAGEALIGLGNLAREWNDLETARRLLSQGIELAMQWRPMQALVGWIALTRTCTALGDPTAAESALQTALELARQIDYTDIDDVWVSFFKASLRLAQGDQVAAEQWARRCGLDRPPGEDFLQPSSDYKANRIRKYQLLVLVRLRLAQGCPAEALAWLAVLLPHLQRFGRAALLIEANLLQALALEALGKGVDAFAALEESLQAALPGGYIRLFVDEGAKVKEILSTFRQHIQGHPSRQALAAYTERLLSAFPSSPVQFALPPAEPPPLSEPLSARELEVLRLLLTPLTVTEIASRLVVAESTVRTHIKHIYNKLDAHNRIDAVERARQLALL